MADKFQNKYRISSHRKPNWDYNAKGLYFITIVTQHRECNLGTIENNEMVYSDFGKIINNEWYKSFDIRKELLLDEFIIMPNHIHAIIILDNTDDIGNSRCTDQQSNGVAVRLPKSISSFFAGFKSSVNSKIDDYIDEKQLDIPKYNRNNHFFQPNYHDHIIRDNGEYMRIADYIANNPKNWNTDKLNTL